MADFHKEHQSLLVPKGLAFFQSQWDESVRNAYHNILGVYFFTLGNETVY